MLSFTTTNRHGYSVKFSPFNSNLVVASSQLYGLAGGGTLYYLENGDESITEIRQFQWTDGLFDVVWSQQNENIVATCSGDGSIQIWNLFDSDKQPKPIFTYTEHTSEVYSLDWDSYWNCNNILSSSWDGTLKIWDPNNLNSLATFNYSDNSMVYSAAFATLIPNIFSSVSTNGSLNLWNSLDFSGKPLAIVAAHDGEVLTCNWSPFNQWMIATGGSDGLIKGWDIRYLRNHESLFELYGCDYAIRRIRFSPFYRNVLMSGNFDCTTKIWDFSEKSDPLEILENHTEFVYGIDWSLNNRNQIVDCGWDSKVNIFTSESLKNY